MSFICNLCGNSFTRNDNLTKHLNNNEKCIIAFKKLTALDIHKKIEELKKSIILTNSDNANIHSIVNSHNNNINLNVAIQIQPIQKLSLEHISTDLMKEIIEKYDDDLSQSSMNRLFSRYLNNVLCDAKHKENHAIKYMKKYPPTFNSVIEDKDGNIISTIKDLNGTCELLSDPVLDLLKKKLKEFIKKYQKDDHPDFDWDLYEKSIIELRKELNKGNVKKVLNSFLKNDILNNIEMKLSINEKIKLIK
jgi:hypothetical protein